jgi:coenzyme F420-reducing hydrogenase delta subunit
VKYAATLLDEIGLGGERVAMANVSSAMGAQFADLVTDMIDRLRGLGPSPVKNSRPTPTLPDGGHDDRR